MNLPLASELEELYPGLSGLVNVEKIKKAQIRYCLQQLQRAIRPWIIKESLYNRDSDLFINVEQEASINGFTSSEVGSFNFAHWRNAFLLKFPEVKNKTFRELLLFEESIEQENDWQTQLKIRYNLDDSLIQTLINSKIFNVSRRTLSNDFKRLSQLQSPYLIEIDSRMGYKRIDLDRRTDTKAEANNNSSDSLNVLEVELRNIAEQLGNVEGVQRFFIHTEYIVKGEAQDLVGNAIAYLKKVWSQKPVPLIKISYDSASLYRHPTRIVYPICVRYIKRALYLAAYGQGAEKRQQLDYKNYRLDKITKIEALEWNTSEIPTDLKQQLWERSPEKYIPEYITYSSLQALGSDFYQPIATMLLRFPQRYHEAYIENTLRHETFKQIDTKDVASLNKLFSELNLDSQEIKTLQQKIACFPKDAYYRLNYRIDDKDVIMRLRAWGANVEVLYPQNLRDRMIIDITNTYAIYQ